MLKIEALTKTYANGHRALGGVTLDIPTGVFGLLGPNGAGKSTLMRTIATLQRPDAGLITLDEQDLLASPERTRQLIGYLPQDFGLYPRATAQAMLDHLAVLKGMTARAERRELIEGLLASVNLWKHQRARLQEFSGGMRQRFGIAQALIGNPRLIIVDEPTAGLDPTERNRVLDLLAERGEHAVVILSTHLVDDVADLCPRMAIMVDGQVRLTSTPANAIAALRGRLWKYPLTPEQASKPLPSSIICTRRVAGSIMAYAIGESSAVHQSTEAEPDLGHVFFCITRLGTTSPQPCVTQETAIA
ncbi:ABC transporter ATP-binding protein [Dyella acidisoli]|uniref:Multidrug ABC transporter ATP-binding protein n=1 Tax=Dyella acidisoli TaxID=1867834 RepID=A0ABQ5XIU4_9GAMM|nr:ABC transporter ATP-binding protein [Dyella acidisoli]GLQ91578.1 multidrug ABC transporter ATP-binding protein [Dyella acidisoli]